MGQERLLTAEEAAAIADEYNETNNFSLNLVLQKVKSAAKRGDKVVYVDQDLLDKHTRGKLIGLGYRLGKKRSSQSDGVYFQAAKQEVIFGNSEEENGD